MKNLLSLVTFVALVLLFACTKESLTVSDVYAQDASVSLSDRSGGKAGKHGGFRHHLWDSLHVHDSTHVHDSIHVHHHDSTHINHDSIHHDTTHMGGGHHGHGGGPQGAGCNTPPVAITVADLPQAAQDWLVANPPAAAIESVLRITSHDCTVGYVVKLADGKRIRFDADGNRK